MKNFFNALYAFMVGIFIITIIVLLKLTKTNITTYLHIKGFAFIAIAIVSLFVVTLLAYSIIKSSKEDKEPLGLPPGSIRAMIAVLVLVFYILVSIAFSFSPALKDNEVAKDILKTLGTLLIAVSAFYFGSKATEQGSKIAIDALNTAKKNTTDDSSDEAVPLNIIEEAINKNSKDWIEKYNCLSIKAGKKKTESTGTTHDVDCIVFIVKTKPSPDNANIPTTITYKSGDNKTYNILTDVQEEQKSDGEQVDENVNEEVNAEALKDNAQAQQPSDVETPVDIDITKKSEPNE